MRITWKMLLIAVVIPLTGCHHYGFLVKREQELECPTDIRQTVPWCAGEDAVFQCPCGPSSHYHGMRPPAWRPWPTSGAEWRDAYGAMPTANCEPAVKSVMPGEELMVPTEALPQQVAPPELPMDGGTESSSDHETRLINPGYEGLGPFETASSSSAGQSSTRAPKLPENRRPRSLDIASDSWINH